MRERLTVEADFVVAGETAHRLATPIFLTACFAARNSIRRWDHGVDLTGVRAAVIGSARTSCLAEIAPQVARLDGLPVLPNWLTSRRTAPYAPRTQRLSSLPPAKAYHDYQRFFFGETVEH